MNPFAIAVAAFLWSSAACAQAGSDRLARDSAAATIPTLVDTAAASRAVQSFYDWYAPMVAGSGSRASGPPWWRAMKPEFLSPGLIAALRNDSTHRDPDGAREFLMKDPILDSQDPCTPYKVTKVRSQGIKAIVSVAPACGRLQDRTKVDVEVLEMNGHLVISDIRLPGSITVRELICRDATMGDQRRRQSTCSWLSQP